MVPRLRGQRRRRTVQCGCVCPRSTCLDRGGSVHLLGGGPYPHLRAGGGVEDRRGYGACDGGNGYALAVDERVIGVAILVVALVCLFASVAGYLDATGRRGG